MVRTTTFRVGSSYALPAVVRSLGHSPESVFAAAGVDPELYSNPENRIAAEALGRLFLNAAQITGRQDIALVVTSGFQPPGLGLVGLLAAEGPDVETALRNLVRMLRHNTLAGYPVLSVAGDIAMMKFELRHAEFPGAEFILEGATCITFRFMQWLCGRSWQPEEIHLSRRTPANQQMFSDFFGAPVRFSSTEDGVLFSADWLRTRVARERQRLRQMKLEIGAAPFSELVRCQVAIDLGFGSPTGARLATQLGLSRRQLFRHLASEGTTCQALVDDVRFSRARYLLGAGDAPIADIAFALGYPDQSSFSRAFARWSGSSPGKWRRHHQMSVGP